MTVTLPNFGGKACKCLLKGVAIGSGSLEWFAARALDRTIVAQAV